MTRPKRTTETVAAIRLAMLAEAREYQRSTHGLGAPGLAARVLRRWARRLAQHAGRRGVR